MKRVCKNAKVPIHAIKAHCIFCECLIYIYHFIVTTVTTYYITAFKSNGWCFFVVTYFICSKYKVTTNVCLTFNKYRLCSKFTSNNRTFITFFRTTVNPLRGLVVTQSYHLAAYLFKY